MPILPFLWPGAGSWCQTQAYPEHHTLCTTLQKDNYQVHYKEAHVGKWTENEAISFEDKKVYFNKRLEFKDTLFSFFDDANSAQTFTISVPIVKVLIGELFFNSKDETILAVTALVLFRRQKNDSYTATIKTPLRYQLAVQHTSAGLSFRQTATVIQQHQRLTMNAKLTGVTDSLVNG